MGWPSKAAGGASEVVADAARRRVHLAIVLGFVVTTRGGDHREVSHADCSAREGGLTLLQNCFISNSPSGKQLLGNKKRTF